MTRYEPLGRRSFIAQLGKGVFGIAVVGGFAAACADDGGTTTTRPVTTEVSGAGSSSTTASSTTTSSTAPATTVASETTAAPTTSEVPGDDVVRIQRVNLGFVSAYLLVRGSEAAVVDTGVSGSAGSIEQGLSELGLGWGAIGHVILTHLHGDHVGSLGDVMASAADAVGYAGEADISGISSPRPLVAVGAGDTVFGMDIIPTPGHTPGHISVFDPAARALIAGDAINGAGSGAAGADASGVGGPNPQFTPDMGTATQSVAVLAALQPDAIFFGHGEPLIGGAAGPLADLAAGG